VFNVPFTNYSATVDYRVNGASVAAKVGAVAMLMRSVTPYSLYTTHTGVQHYQPNVTQIPCAAITVEDAELMARMQARGQNVTLSMFMGASLGPPVTSYNILAELIGAESPEEIVLMGGHVDSWDVGTGCMDDGGGLFSAWQAITQLNYLVQSNIIPRPARTIRLIAWVDEEIGQQGARTYAKDYAAQLPNHVIAFESDGGNFMPQGYGFSGTSQAAVIMNQIGSVLLAAVNTSTIISGPGDGSDTDNGFLAPAGVPTGSMMSAGFYGYPTTYDAYYFNYHHSNADTFTSINPQGIENSVASFAVMSYVLADMTTRLPFGNNATSSSDDR